jgi:hypothetical protein
MRTHLLAVAILVTATGAAQSPGRLVETQRYGWENPEQGPRPLTLAERKLHGGMLGGVTAVAEGPGGALYVLDLKESKVVVFNRDGTLRRVFAGGSGRGPGEFDRPRSIAVTDAGEVFVLDQTLLRYTVFDTAGAVKRTVTSLPTNQHSLFVANDRVYVTGQIHQGKPAVLVFDRAGNRVEQVGIPDAEDAMFGEAGDSYHVERLRNGGLVVAHPNPGTWSPIANPSQRTGRSFITDNKVRADPRPPAKSVSGLSISSAPTARATTRGFGQLADGRVVVYYQDMDAAQFEKQGYGKLSRGLAVFRADGTLIARVPVPEDFSFVFAVSRDGNDLFFVSEDPFPQVVRMRLDIGK